MLDITQFTILETLLISKFNNNLRFGDFQFHQPEKYFTTKMSHQLRFILIRIPLCSYVIRLSKSKTHTERKRDIN